VNHFEIRALLERIAKGCKIYMITVQKPMHFRVSIESEDIRFNHCVAVDVMYISSKPALHVVCEATHYQAARLFSNMTANETWKLFSESWSKNYLGPPDILRIDQCTNFMADKFLSGLSSPGHV
jgi:hypothetical protein